MENEETYNRIVEFLAGDATELIGENIDLLLDNPIQTELALKELWDKMPLTPLEVCDYSVREDVLKAIKIQN